MAKAPKRLPPKRRDSPHVARAIRRHAVLLGEITYHWNALHSNLQMILAALLGEAQSDGSYSLTLGLGIWQALKSDDAQRSVLRVAIQSKLAANKRLVESALWLIDQTGRLAAYRNDVTHVPFTLVGTAEKIAFVPDRLFSDKNRLARLTSTGHTALFRALRGDLTQLGNYATFIWIAALTPSALIPLPRRLRLQSPRLVERGQQKSQTRPQSLAKPKRQRRASPGKRKPRKGSGA